MTRFSVTTWTIRSTIISAAVITTFTSAVIATATRAVIATTISVTAAITISTTVTTAAVQLRKEAGDETPYEPKSLFTHLEEVEVTGDKGLMPVTKKYVIPGKAN